MTVGGMGFIPERLLMMMMMMMVVECIYVGIPSGYRISVYAWRSRVRSLLPVLFLFLL